MRQRTIAGRRIGALGLGCMGMSHAYGPGDEAENLRVLVRSLELGIDFWDTADMYGAGENERLLAKALSGKRDKVFLASKFGNVYDRSLTTHQDLVRDEAFWIVDGTPKYVREACERSLERLGTDHIDLYYQHRVDPRTPIEETVGAMARLVEEGKVRYIGLSEAAPDTIRRAHKVHPIAAVQTEYSLWTRHIEAEILPACRELGIAFVPYSPLGRGFLTGGITSPDALADDDWRRMNPRFQGENFQANLKLVRRLEEIAARRNATPAQLALAWVLAQGDDIVPIPGTKRLKYLEENAMAADTDLTEQERSALDHLDPAAGERYPPRVAHLLNG